MMSSYAPHFKHSQVGLFVLEYFSNRTDINLPTYMQVATAIDRVGVDLKQVGM
jgi:hypothetical protein